jgi:hypothetical protein
MNCPVNTARRDAAHDRVVALLRRRVKATANRAARAALYQQCLRLLDDALIATTRSQITQDTPALHYLRLIRDTMAAGQALVQYELRLASDADTFRRILGPELADDMRIADSLFSHSEESVLSCLAALQRSGESILAQDTQTRTAEFSTDDRRRYDLALAEYRAYYRRGDRGTGGVRRSRRPSPAPGAE